MRVDDVPAGNTVTPVSEKHEITFPRRRVRRNVIRSGFTMTMMERAFTSGAQLSNPEIIAVEEVLVKPYTVFRA